MTKEQRDVLECAARWIWHGVQPVGHAKKGDPFRYWERRLERAAVRMLNAECGTRGRVKRETLASMLGRIARGGDDASKETT